MKGTIRAELFAAAYIKSNGRGARAMAVLGHKGNTDARAQAASMLLRKAEVQKALADLRKGLAMDALETIARTADIARATMDDFIDTRGNIDIERARRRGKLHLLREYKVRTETQKREDQEPTIVTHVQVKLHDAQAALKTLMQHHGLLTEILEIRRLPKDPSELRQFVKDRIPLLFETDPGKVH